MNASIFDGTEKPPGYWREQMKLWAEKRELRMAWEREHPEFAREWSAAIIEDRNRSRARSRETHEADEMADVDIHLEGAGVPSSIAAMVKSNDPPPAYKRTVGRVAAFMENTMQSFLLLAGDPSTGKTTAAATALLTCKGEFISDEVGKSWKWWIQPRSFVTAHELSGLSYFNPDDKALLAALKAKKVLIIDDLGLEMMSESWKSNFDDLISARHGNQKKTLLTANIAVRAPKEGQPSPFEIRYGSRVARRIREKGSVFQATKEAP